MSRKFRSCRASAGGAAAAGTDRASPTARQTADAFEIVWPERVSFPIAPQETFCFRDGERLYFERWYEDPDYRTEIVVRDLDGNILDQRPGAAQQMPDGQLWTLE